MTTKQKIVKLNWTINKLKKLKPQQFQYNTYVEHFNYETNCGTVCYIVGWYPKWFPSSKFTWDGEKLSKLKHEDYLANIRGALKKYHGLEIEEINYLFYGEVYKEEPELSFLERKHLTIENVIKRFERIINELKETI